MNTLLEEFQAYWKLSDELVAMASKEDIVEVARILAFQAAHYTRTFGELPIPDVQRLLSSPDLDESGVSFLSDGAKAFVGVLATVTAGSVRDDFVFQ